MNSRLREMYRLSRYRRANNWNPVITETELTPIQAVQELDLHHIVINPNQEKQLIRRAFQVMSESPKF